MGFFFVWRIWFKFQYRNFLNYWTIQKLFWSYIWRYCVFFKAIFKNSAYCSPKQLNVVLDGCNLIKVSVIVFVFLKFFLFIFFHFSSILLITGAEPDEWNDIVKKVMTVDNSWNNTAGKYIEIYESVRAW